MNSKALSLLIIEDDLLSRIGLAGRLKNYGHVAQASSEKEAILLMELDSYDLAFVDLDLERELAGLQLISLLKARGTYVVVLSGREEDKVISAAYEQGAGDFLSKPFTKESIELIIKKFNLLKNNNSNLLRLQQFFMTQNYEVIEQLKIIEQAVSSALPVLITGETGTGKTMLAKYIHELDDSEKPFIHLNCSEISESLIESELFGHEKGSFTGAHKTKKGLLELANGGTLFLDEIATLSLNVQKKLLKAIEEKVFYPVGSEKTVCSSFRLISATCEDLKLKQSRGEFRQDFLFRIEGHNIQLRSLRNRREDIIPIAQIFLKKGPRKIVLSEAVKQQFLNYEWPGNIRELERTIEVLRNRSNGIIQLQDLAGLLSSSCQQIANELSIDLQAVKSMGLNAYIEMIEAKITEKILKENNDKVRKTMADLKLSNNSFYRIITNLKAQELKNAGQ